VHNPCTRNAYLIRELKHCLEVHAAKLKFLESALLSQKQDGKWKLNDLPDKQNGFGFERGSEIALLTFRGAASAITAVNFSGYEEENRATKILRQKSVWKTS
jgi:hypothetical protein